MNVISAPCTSTLDADGVSACDCTLLLGHLTHPGQRAAFSWVSNVSAGNWSTPDTRYRSQVSDGWMDGSDCKATQEYEVVFAWFTKCGVVLLEEKLWTFFTFYNSFVRLSITGILWNIRHHSDVLISESCGNEHAFCHAFGFQDMYPFSQTSKI